MAEPMTNEEILAQLREYVDIGILGFVVPTDPLGEEWVLGITDTTGKHDIAKLTTEQTFGFILGVSGLANAITSRNGGVIRGL
jgi:hypothetical protein